MVETFKLSILVLFSLICIHGKAYAFFNPFGFDDTNWFLVYDENVNGRANVGLVFRDGYTLVCIKIEMIFILNNPAALYEFSGYFVTSKLFGVLIH